MTRSMRCAANGVLAAALLAAGTAQAQVVESGDAGQLIGSAQNTATGTGAALTSITGSIASGADIDLYRIYIAMPSLFSATTINAVTGAGDPFAFDTKLFLFSEAGLAIETNDDADGNDIRAALTAGNAFAPTTAGYYYLGISNGSQEASNGPAPNQDLFTQETVPTGIRGPALGVNPATLGGSFDVSTGFADTGAYRIDLTGVTTGPAAAGAVPEPASWAMMLAGFGVAGLAMRRRRVGTFAAAA